MPTFFLYTWRVFGISSNKRFALFNCFFILKQNLNQYIISSFLKKTLEPSKKGESLNGVDIPINWISQKWFLKYYFYNSTSMTVMFQDYNDDILMQWYLWQCSKTRIWTSKNLQFKSFYSRNVEKDTWV